MEATKVIKERVITLDQHNRTKERVNEDFDQIAFTMNSMTEAEEFERVFPVKVPSGFRFFYKWSSTPKGGRKLTCGVEAAPEGSTGDATGSGSATSERKKLEEMSKADLATRCAELSITLPPNANKSQMVAAILDAGQKPPAVTTPPGE